MAQDKREIYSDIRVRTTAALCKMGDIVAMADMAYVFRDRCTEPLRKRLEAYERNPDKENEDLLAAFLNENRQEMRTAQAYMMWLVRAALYGNEKAKNLIDCCPYYKQKSYIPDKLLEGDEKARMDFWDSDSLWEIGLVDMPRGCTDCRLWYDRRRGCFVVMYVEDYIPADEYGFGAEWDYDYIYLDEFFYRLPIKKEQDIQEQLMILEKEREAFWKHPRHDAPRRKYRWRI